MSGVLASPVAGRGRACELGSASLVRTHADGPHWEVGMPWWATSNANAVGCDHGPRVPESGWRARPGLRPRDARQTSPYAVPAARWHRPGLRSQTGCLTCSLVVGWDYQLIEEELVLTVLVDVLHVVVGAAPLLGGLAIGPIDYPMLHPFHSPFSW